VASQIIYGMMISEQFKGYDITVNKSIQALKPVV